MKEFWFMGAPANEHQQSLVSLFLRLFIGIAMLTHGLPKLENFAQLASVFPDPLNIGSQASLALATFAEVGCSFMLIIGLFTRLASLTLVINMAVASMLVAGGDGFSSHELAAIYLVIYVAITVLGAGFYSVDWLLFIRNYHFKQKECVNVTPLDRMIRLLLGLLCWFLIFTNVVTGVWIVVLLLLSVPLLASSFWGYCGLYALLFRKNECNPK
ncbi:MAG: DoxX family protein [Phocaeicola sp.]